MRRWLVLFLAMTLSTSLAACGGDDPKDADTSEQSVDVEKEEVFTDAANINVRMGDTYIEDDGLHIKVFVANDSEEVFSGSVHVTFCEGDGKGLLGYDLIIVDDLLPGRESWATVVVEPYDGTPEMIVEFTDVEFTPVEVTTADVDSETTEKVKNSYYLNFDGVSWYEDVTDVTVYTDGSCIVTVKNDAKEKGQFYASTIWSCGEQHGVETVQVVNSNGDILAVY